MIKPAAYWALHKTCDPYTLGRVAVSLGGQIVDPPLNPAEKALVSVVEQDSEWMDERTEAQRERWKERQRKSRLSRDVTVTERDNEMSQEKGQCHVTSIRPSVHTNKESTNRSVTVPADATNGNGNGTESLKIELMPGGLAEAKRLAAEFAKAAKADQGAFFAPDFDAVTVCAAVTGDFKSLKRWRQLVKNKGDDRVREETFTFWREISAGEDVANRGAALNERLGNLPDAKGSEA